jgi:hypothetical protein
MVHEFLKPAHHPPEVLVKKEFKHNESDNEEKHIRQNFRPRKPRKNRRVAKEDDPNCSEWDSGRTTTICCDLESGKRNRT